MTSHCEPPEYHRYFIRSIRQLSYLKWPIILKQTPQGLSEAGFSTLVSLCVKISHQVLILSQTFEDKLSKTGHKLQTCLSFSGRCDHVICLHCGVETGKWLETGEPWVEHAKWSPTCLYVIHLKGLEFVEQCQLLLPNKKQLCTQTALGWLCEFIQNDRPSRALYWTKTQMYCEESV